jgi:hypothetical protein
MSNTKEFGALRFFIYPDMAEKAFVGVCIDLGIVKVDKNLDRLKKDLEEAAQGYVEGIIKYNLNEALLNQKPPKKYLDLYERYLSELKKSIRSNHHPWYKTTVRSRLPFVFSDAQIFTKNVCPAIG